MYKIFSFQNIIHWKRKLITPKNVDVERKENWELLLLLQFAEASADAIAISVCLITDSQMELRD